MVAVSKEWKELARINGISTATVYRRLRQGWKIEDAVAVPTDPKQISKRKISPLYGLPRGRSRGFRLPQANDAAFDQAVKQSGLTESDWVAIVVCEKLKRDR